MVGRHDLMIGHATPEHPSVFDRVTRVAMIHFTDQLDIIQAPPAPKNNGMN
jgi:hypothetical protein